ncbi:MAG TPA: murein biosynthesis integral membrane protein MurJ [Bryobacteraceae bacterium]|nr:murein biosynthesis integral membrane protein MurJ [Bryobacteraceae bacterium]
MNTENASPKPPANAVRTAQSEQVARSAGVVSIAIMISRLTGLVRETIMAHLFGAGFIFDAFLLGFRVPSLARNLFAEGAFSSAFVPTFTATLSQEGKEEAERLLNLVSTATCVVIGLFCVLGVLFSPQFVWLLAPGYEAVPGKFALAVHMSRIMFPFLLLVTLAAQAMGVLNSCNQFFVPALASTMFNIGSVVSGLALGFWFGPRLGISPIEGMAYGVVIGGGLQLLWQLPSLHRAGFHFRPSFAWNHPGMRKILLLMGPALLGGAALQINVMVNTNFASRIADPLRGHDGPVSWLSYSFRFMQLPLGLFGAAFASALLPAVSRSASEKNFVEFRRTMSHTFSLVFLMTIPASVGLIILGRPIIGAIFQGGRFDAYDTKQTAVALSCFAIGLLGYSATKILNPAFYALSDAHTPMYASLLSILANFGIAFALLRWLHFGHAALALSTSAVAILEALFLFERLRRKLGGLEGRFIVQSLGRVCLATALMAVPVAGANYWFGSHTAMSRLGYLSEIAVCLPVGLIVFAGSARLLGVEELSYVTGLFLRARAKF